MKNSKEVSEKVNKIDLNAILEKSKELTKKTSSSTKKGMYKFVFANSEDDEDFLNAKNHIPSLNFEKRNTSGQRSKIRKHLESLVNSFNKSDNKSDKETIIIGFIKFYKDCYLINDFDVDSLCNVSSNNYNLIDTFLKEVKKVKVQQLDYKEIYANL